MLRLDSPKEPILELMPYIVSKAILLTFKQKIMEQLENLVENESDKDCNSAENMVYSFVLALFNSGEVTMSAINS